MGERRSIWRVLGWGLAALWLFSTACFGLKLDVQQSISTTNILVGDVFQYVLKIDSPKPIAIDTPPFESLLTDFQVHNVSESEESTSSNSTHTFMVDLSSYKVDGVQIPGMTLGFTLDGKSYSYHVHAVNVPVKSLLVSTANLVVRDVKPLVAVSFNWAVWVLGILVLGVGVAGSVWGIQLWRRRLTTRVASVQFVDQRPILEICMERLTQLESSNLIGQGDVKAHYRELADILKTYLHRQFQTHILEMTTEEVLAFVSSELTVQTTRRIGHVLTACDLAKFAPFHPSEIESMDSVVKCRNVIQELDEVFKARVAKRLQELGDTSA